MRPAYAPIALALTVALLAPVVHAQSTAPITALEGGVLAITGTVESVADTTLTVSGVNGERVTVDVSALDKAFRKALVPGQTVRVLAGRADGRLVAQGVVLHHDVPPAALPRP